MHHIVIAARRIVIGVDPVALRIARISGVDQIRARRAADDTVRTTPQQHSIGIDMFDVVERQRAAVVEQNRAIFGVEHVKGDRSHVHDVKCVVVGAGGDGFVAVHIIAAAAMDGVGILFAQQRVSAARAIKHVRAVGALHVVVAGAAIDGIVITGPGDGVVARAAIDKVIAKAAKGAVVAVACVHNVIVHAAINNVVADAAKHRIIARIAAQEIVARAAIQRVVAQVALAIVIAGIGVDQVIAVAAVSPVVARACRHAVIAAIGIDLVVIRPGPGIDRIARVHDVAVGIDIADADRIAARCAPDAAIGIAGIQHQMLDVGESHRRVVDKGEGAAFGVRGIERHRMNPGRRQRIFVGAALAAIGDIARSAGDLVRVIAAIDRIDADTAGQRVAANATIDQIIAAARRHIIVARLGKDRVVGAVRAVDPVALGVGIADIHIVVAGTAIDRAGNVHRFNAAERQRAAVKEMHGAVFRVAGVVDGIDARDGQRVMVIAAFAAIDTVPGGAGDRVAVVARVKPVRAVAASEEVSPGRAIDRVRARATGQGVISGPAIDHIRPVPGGDVIIARVAKNRVVACGFVAIDVIASAKRCMVVARPAKHAVGFAPGIDDIVARARRNAVRPGPGHDVIAVAGGAANAKRIATINQIAVRIADIAGTDQIRAATAFHDAVRRRQGRGGDDDIADIAGAGAINDRIGQRVAADIAVRKHRDRAIGVQAHLPARRQGDRLACNHRHAIDIGNGQPAVIRIGVIGQHVKRAA